MSTDLDKVKESLGGFDPSAVEVSAPLMLVNSLVPHSGGCVGGYTVTVGRCSPSGRLEGPPQFHEAVPYGNPVRLSRMVLIDHIQLQWFRSELALGMACPKLSIEDREQFRRAVPRQPSALHIHTQSTISHSCGFAARDLRLGNRAAPITSQRRSGRGKWGAIAVQKSSLRLKMPLEAGNNDHRPLKHKLHWPSLSMLYPSYCLLL